MAKPTPWYKYPYTPDYGGVEPYSPPPGTAGYYPKPDINIQCPDGTPITALLPGVISGINSSDGHVPAWGACMTIRLDKPVNAVATHMAYLHLEPLESHFQIGQHISKGDVIGYSGGQTAAGSEHVPVGIALCDGDIYGETGFRDQYLGSAWLDPSGVLKAAGNAGTGTSQTPGEMLTNAFQAIRPDENVAQLLWSLDVALRVQNPFVAANTAAANAQPIKADIAGPNIPFLNKPLFDLPVTVPNQIADPFIWLGDVAEALLQNFAAVFVRTLFIVFGIMILYVVVQASMLSQINQVLEPVGGASGGAEKLLALA